MVIVNGKPEKHPEGAYYLEWREQGRRVRLSVGKDAQDAAAKRQRKQAELHAINNGVTVLAENGNGQRSLPAAVADFLDETKLTKKPKKLSRRSGNVKYGGRLSGIHALSWVAARATGLITRNEGV